MAQTKVKFAKSFDYIPGHGQPQVAYPAGYEGNVSAAALEAARAAGVLDEAPGKSGGGDKGE